MGSVFLCYTYHCLCRANDRATTDLAGCTPLMMSWIYQRFSWWCPDARNVVVFPLASSLHALCSVRQHGLERGLSVGQTDGTNWSLQPDAPRHKTRKPIFHDPIMHLEDYQSPGRLSDRDGTE
ncbi:hypothetical protein PIB30_041814 [Stylosanthes scabra]|uniref:Aminotransferase-like plant mobile domain-containing protein n=1 Tax=Stylosanthes scabra TaxID=79078 RepID=A0ABU6ZDT0_9FABA|nr:hypothetical protein [Stylosanthes scabra]